MAKHVTTTAEFRNMQPEDLQREVKEKRQIVAKMRLGLEMRSEKDSAQYKRERKELAKMLTVLHEKQTLKTAVKSAKVPAPKAK